MHDQLTVGGLFSGIGGWELGLERAGMRVVWHCESDPFCRRVLGKHWPGVPCHEDVRDLHAGAVGHVDVLCGGFPCQDISKAGKRVGIDGARSGLWAEYARLVGELRPRYVLVENVADLLVRGLDRVAGDLSALGYDAEWDCIPASVFDAPHQRDRLWLVAYPSRDLQAGAATTGPERERTRAGSAASRAVADSNGEGSQGHRRSVERPGELAAASSGPAGGNGAADPRRAVDDAVRGRHGASEEPVRPGRDGLVDTSGWLAEPDVGRVAHGIPDRVDRLRSLGNALVPQIAEWIGRRILEWEGMNA